MNELQAVEVLEATVNIMGNAKGTRVFVVVAHLKPRATNNLKPLALPFGRLVTISSKRVL